MDIQRRQRFTSAVLYLLLAATAGLFLTLLSSGERQPAVAAQVGVQEITQDGTISRFTQVEFEGDWEVSQGENRTCVRWSHTANDPQRVIVSAQGEQGVRQFFIRVDNLDKGGEVIVCGDVIHIERTGGSVEQ